MLINEMLINERGYLTLMSEILLRGHDKVDRTGVGTRGFFGAQLHFNLEDGFPLLTTKKMFMRGIIEELLWFIRGETNVQSLQTAGVNIWDEWATKEQCAKFGRPEGDLGPVYGHQFRNFGATRAEVWGSLADPAVEGAYLKNGVDQLERVVADIQKTPNSRRLIVTAWNPKEADQVTLPPCHCFFQFHVMNGELSCQMYMRSADLFLGVPFNIASYALLTHMVAKVTNLKVGKLVVSFGDVHIYKNHFEQCQLQLSREPAAPPKLLLDASRTKLEDFRLNDFMLEEYSPHPSIKAEVAV